MRICSLSPSATEVVLALGLADKLVAVTDQCYGVDELPRVARSFVPTDASSREIEDMVSRHRSRWGTIFEVDEQLLARLEPDLILTQQVCEVCAVPADFAQDAAGRVACEATVLTFSADTLSDIRRNIRALGEVAGGEAAVAATGLVEQLDATSSRIAARVRDRERPRVFCLEWIAPLRSAGHWIPELIEIAGGSVAHRGGITSWADVHEWNPDTIIAMPCGWNIPRISEEWKLFTQQHPPTAEVEQAVALPPVFEGRMWIADGNLCSRYGPGVMRTLETFASIIHPDLFGPAAPECAVPIEEITGVRPDRGDR